MFDTPKDIIVWLVEIKHRQDEWRWETYIHLATRRQAREMAADVRREGHYGNVRVTRIVGRGGW